MDRDPRRIRDFLDVVAHTWAYVPDYRFWQFILTFQSFVGRDMFYMEEDELIEWMHKYQETFGYD